MSVNIKPNPKSSRNPTPKISYICVYMSDPYRQQQRLLKENFTIYTAKVSWKS